MIIEKIEGNKLQNKEFLNDLSLEYAIEYFIDRVKVGAFNGEVKLEDLIEGRYFSGSKELRVIKGNSGFIANLVTHEDMDETIMVEHLVIDNKFGDIKKVQLKKYIDYDNDGQGFIKYTRPCKLV